MTETENWQTASDDDANAEEWREVDAEVKIVLEVEGDGWIGRYTGMDPRNENGIIQAHFTTVTFLNGDYIADTAFVNVTRDLENKLRRIPVKSIVRAEWMSSMDTGHESGTKMRVFKVQWK